MFKIKVRRVQRAGVLSCADDLLEEVQHVHGNLGRLEIQQKASYIQRDDFRRHVTRQRCNVNARSSAVYGISAYQTTLIFLCVSHTLLSRLMGDHAHGTVYTDAVSLKNSENSQILIGSRMSRSFPT